MLDRLIGGEVGLEKDKKRFALQYDEGFASLGFRRDSSGGLFAIQGIIFHSSRGQDARNGKTAA